MTGTQEINYTDFRKVYLTTGLAVTAQKNSSATIPAYLIQLSFGKDLASAHKADTKREYFTSSAQLTSNHSPEDIVNQLMIAVTNFPRKQIGKVLSDCLVTGVQTANGSSEDKRLSTVFVTTSSLVEPGSRVGILAQKELVTTNIRNLDWHDFSKLDLRVGTLETCLISQTIDSVNSVNKVLFHIRLDNESLKTCVGLLQAHLNVNTLIGKQVLVLVNLDNPSKTQYFGELGPIDTVLCTIEGETVLTPAKKVNNGYSLA